MPLTKKQIKEYVAQDGSQCPFCESPDTHNFGYGLHFGKTDAIVEGLEECSDCGKKWKSIYKLSGVVEVI